MSSKKPNGYWKDSSNLRRELESIIQELGAFPSRDYLRAQHQTSLLAAIYKHPAEVQAIREKYGFESEKPKGYWKDKQNIRTELKAVVKSLGHFPTQIELASMGQNGLVSAITDNYPGGLSKLREEFGYEPVRRPAGYWENPENTKAEVQAFINEHGAFPSAKLLDKLGKQKGQYSLVSITAKYPGGARALRKELGLDVKKRENGHWTEDTIQAEMQTLTDRLGHIPTTTELVDLGMSGLCHAIGSVYPGGMNAMRKCLGSTDQRRAMGYWTPETVRQEMEQLIKELGTYPKSKQLNERGLKPLTLAICRVYPGGANQLRRDLGYERDLKPRGYWLNYENIESTLKDITTELGHFPSQSDLLKRRQLSLATAIRVHHGGLAALRERMGYGQHIHKQDEMTAFLSEDAVARNLLTVAITRPAIQSDIEGILLEAYPDRFASQYELHDLLKDGVTSLGAYLGSVSSDDREIIPTFMGSAIESIPEERLTPGIEERILKLFRTTYSPMFNENPTSTIQGLQEKAKTAKKPLANIYSKLQTHYKTTLELEIELL